jgi:hypothetical protein
MPRPCCGSIATGILADEDEDEDAKGVVASFQQLRKAALSFTRTENRTAEANLCTRRKRSGQGAGTDKTLSDVGDDGLEPPTSSV